MAAAFAPFDGARYLNLETYRRDGRPVRTPLWFAAGPAADGPVLYVYSLTNSGKAKRLRRSAESRIAPCDGRGRLRGDWVPARASIVTGPKHTLGMRLLDRKYWPWKQMLNAMASLFNREQRIVIAIRPR